MNTFAPRPGDKAVHFALHKRGKDVVDPDICQIFTRGCFGTPPSGGSAIIAFRNAVQHGVAVKTSVPREVPRGVAAYFSGGKSGHAVTSLGGGKCVSTDWPNTGDVSVARLADIAETWSKRLVGYVLIDANGFILRELATVDLSNMQQEARNGGKRERAGVRRIQFALNARYGFRFSGNGLFGPKTRHAYKHHQRKIGSDPAFIDGVPGPKDLRNLGRGRFRVIR